jgi:hypothetical protein
VDEILSIQTQFLETKPVKARDESSPLSCSPSPETDLNVFLFMPNAFAPSRICVQSLLLAASAFAFYAISDPIAFNSNIVLHNYYLGGLSFIHGLNPYEVTLQNGATNQYKYSPLFALLFAGMASSGVQYVVIRLWVFFGMTLFCFGLSRWCVLSARLALYVYLAFLAAMIDMITSLSVNQANALIAGLILIGLAEYRDNRPFSAGAILLLATNLKVYPVIFLVAIASRMKPLFWLGALSSGVVVFIVPAFFVGFSHNLETHLEWVKLVLRDCADPGRLNLPTAFDRVGWPGTGHALDQLVFILTLPVFFAYLPLAKTIDWGPWMTMGLSALLLISPESEVFTYVLLAPAYVLMTFWCSESSHPKIRLWAGSFVAVLAVAIASCRYADVHWYASENPIEIIRVLGALGIWCFSAVLVGKALYRAVESKFSASLRASSA